MIAVLKEVEMPEVFLNTDLKMIKKYKNSDQPESNQRPIDNYRTLQSTALPTELWSVLGTCDPLNLNYTPISWLASDTQYDVMRI